jgi:hypothetical protein
VSPTFIGTNGGTLDTPPLPATGTYTILVDPQGTNTGSITLTLSQDVTGTMTINGPAVTVNLTRPGQNARLTFGGTVGQRVSLGMTDVTIGTSTCCGSQVSISTPDGTVLVSPTFIGTNGGTLDTPPLPATGTYTILVDPGGTSTGSITLTLSQVP